MKRHIAHITLATLAGAGLTYVALIATPLSAQVINRHMFESQNPESGWVMPRYGQRGQGRGWGRGWNPNGPGPCLMYDGAYDPTNLEIITGRVTNINRGPGQGTWIDIQTDQDTFTVHLGSAWYLEDRGVEIATDDTLEITGFRRSWNGETMIVASKLKYADHTVELRDNNGYPRWMTWQTDP